MELVLAERLCHSLGGLTRFAMVSRLAAGGARPIELGKVRLAQPTMSRRLARLRDCGPVVSDPAGQASLLRLYQTAPTDVPTCADHAGTLCPTCGVGGCKMEAAS